MAPFEMVAFVRNGHFIGLLSSSFVKVVVHVSVSHFVNMSGPLPLTSRFFFPPVLSSNVLPRSPRLVVLRLLRPDL